MGNVVNRSLMSVVFGIAVAAVIAACSASQQRADGSAPHCLSMCSNQFAACTEEFPGDASACLPARNDCERTCEGDAALRRAAGEDGQEVLAPIDSPAMSNPAPVPPAAAPDAGSADAGPDA